MLYRISKYIVNVRKRYQGKNMSRCHRYAKAYKKYMKDHDKNKE